MAIDVTTEEVRLLRECIQADTVNPPGNEDRITQVLRRWLEREGISVQVTGLRAGRSNFLARLSGQEKRPALILSGHTDTVGAGNAWTRDPWSASLEETRLYGRGAADMKSGLAAMAMAMIHLKRSGWPIPGDVILAASVGEEVDCLGAQAFLKEGALLDAGGIIVGEPTGGSVVIAHKGALWLRIKTAGRTAHGSTPHLGINAIYQMADLVNRLRTLELAHYRHGLLGGSTFSVNVIHGGTSTNVVPDTCEVEVDIRTVPGQVHHEVIHAVHAHLQPLELPMDISIIIDRQSVETPVSSSLVQSVLAVGSELDGKQAVPTGAAFYTDASLYQAELGVPVIVYGPGELHQAHQPDEWVDIPAYFKAIEMYKQVCLRWKP